MYITMQLWDEGNLGASSRLTTSIYRIAVSGTDLTLAAQASVSGGPLNQFALDERGDRLRIATTTAWPNPTNEVHVLDLELEEVGSLTGIAPGESIYSCRFMGDRLYLVTFLQVDPCSSSTSRPTRPRCWASSRSPALLTTFRWSTPG
jgi:uncharacterized secreted protein with C-terminal beta-propeller domain